MSFVFPALLGATVLAGIPIVIHLILRQKPKTLPFPAFRFLVARHQTNRRRLQLRHWLLLALRMLLIAGLIFAIARPRLLERNLGLSSERPVAAVFVIDVSASMDARSTDNRSRLDDAKRRAGEMLDALPPGSRAAVVSSSDVHGDWAASLNQARQRIQNLRVEPASPPLPRAVMTAYRLFVDLANKRDDDVGHRLPRLLCVFSDSTQGAWSAAQTPRVVEASDQVPVQRDVLVEGRGDIDAALAQLTDADSSLKEPLTELRDLLPRLTPAEFPLTGRPLQVVQQVRSQIRDALAAAPAEPQGDEAAARRLEALGRLLPRLNGYQTLWFDVGLSPARDLAILDIDWPLTQAGVPQEWIRPGGSLLLRPRLRALGQEFQATLTAAGVKEPRVIPEGASVEVPVEIDAAARKLDVGFHGLEFNVNVRDVLAIDNQRYATFAVRPPRKALVIADAPPTDSDFLRALAIHDVVADVRTPESVEGGIPPGYDAVFLLAVAWPSDAVWQALERYAKSGGGVAIVPGGQEMDPRGYQSPAARRVAPGTYESIVRVGKDADVGTRWDWRSKGAFRHPMLRPFERWILDEKIDFVRFPPRVLAFWETKPAKDDFVLIRYQNDRQSPALLERPIGAGKVLQFTTPLDLREPAWNTYLQTIHSFYVVVTGLMVRHLTGEMEPVRLNFLLGRDEASLPIRLFAGRTGLSLRGPQSGPIAIDESLSHIPFPQANVPGNYQVVDAENRVAAAFSVNLPADEIDLTPMQGRFLDVLFGSDVRIASDRRADLEQLLQGRVSEPMELFPLIMVGLLLLLALENLLSNRFYRGDDPAGEGGQAATGNAGSG